MFDDKRLVAALSAVALVLVIALVGVLTRGGDDDEPGNTDSESPSAPMTAPTTGSPTEESTTHESDHVDTVDPDIDPADYVEFCDAFYGFANAYSSAVADGDPGESMVLASAADSFRAVAEETEMTDEVRAGFEWFVDDAMRIENDATTEEQNAFSTFLNSACPA